MAAPARLTLRVCECGGIFRLGQYVCECGNGYLSKADLAELERDRDLVKAGVTAPAAKQVERVAVSPASVTPERFWRWMFRAYAVALAGGVGWLWLLR